MWKTLLTGAVAAALLASTAEAAEIILDLEGDVSTLSTGSFALPTKLIESGSLSLTGFTPFAVQAGDTLTFTILLNGELSIPARPEMLLGLDFDTSFAGGKSLSGMLTFNNGFEGGGACVNCLAVIVDLPSDQSFSYSALTGTATIDVLDAPAEIDSIRLTYQLTTVVPEPATWATMIGGFGLAGAALRRRRAVLA
jgi:hypothetical protein